MAASARKLKINEKQLLDYIVDLIEAEPDKQKAISSQMLADVFDTAGTTIDYHIKKFLKDGSLVLSKERGKYNRKIYMLPEKPKQASVPYENQEVANEFKSFLQDYLEQATAEKDESQAGPQCEPDLVEKPSTPVVKKEEEKAAQEAFKHAVEKAADEEDDSVHKKELTGLKEKVHESVANNPSQEENLPATELMQTQVKPAAPIDYQVPLEPRELTLDEKIEEFLAASAKVNDANMLLEHEDREILSVMNETIDQTILYLKDLSQQLSTVQSKKIIQDLIDDRNRLIAENERLQKEAEESKQLAKDTADRYDIDPNRVRFMHQMILDTVDNFTVLPNASMALQRKQFNNRVTKEVGDLVKYVLRLED